MEKRLTEIKHPLIQHKLTLMRDKETSSHLFRQLMYEISMLMAYEVSRDFPVTEREVQTPIQKTRAMVIEGKKLVLVSILRAGNGFLEGILHLIPSARVGHIGLYRDPKTLRPVEYYYKVPVDMQSRDVVVVDPMLATGYSAVAAVARIKDSGAKSIKFMSLVSAPEGIETFHKTHPDVHVFTASVDEGLNEHGYIFPGLGDAGDRLYGTR